MADRHLYLSRHAEPGADGGLTDRGVRQAEQLGRRLSHLPLTTVRHGPLPRATQTAQVVAQQLDPAIPVVAHDAAGDYVPHLPSADELAPEHRAGAMAFLSGVTPEEATHGAELAAQTVRLFAGPEPGDREGHHLVITHAFTIGWLLSHAFSAPPWRWLGLDFGHTALTVLRYAEDRPPAVVVVNDGSHLPDDPVSGSP